MPRAARSFSSAAAIHEAIESQILKVEITGYISLSKSMSLRDELVENERAASDPLVRVIFRRENLRYGYAALRRKGAPRRP